MLWTGAQRDRLDVLDVERLAVDAMAGLLSWAETVALGDRDEWGRSLAAAAAAAAAGAGADATTTSSAEVCGGGGGGGEDEEEKEKEEEPRIIAAMAAAAAGGVGMGMGIGMGELEEEEEREQMRKEKDKEGENALWRVFEAGRNLCAWLGVVDGVEAMDMLEGEIWGRRGGVGQTEGTGYGM